MNGSSKTPNWRRKFPLRCRELDILPAVLVNFKIWPTADLAAIAAMHAYRAYLIGHDGHIVSRVDLLCQDDQSAKDKAKQLVDGHDVELWDGAKKIAVFKSEH